MKTRRPRDASIISPFLSMRQVMELVPLSRSSLYLMINHGEFPAPKKLGERAAAWSKKEIEQWIAEKLR